MSVEVAEGGILGPALDHHAIGGDGQAGAIAPDHAMHKDRRGGSGQQVEKVPGVGGGDSFGVER